jgi:hypothetical protein
VAQERVGGGRARNPGDVHLIAHLEAVERHGFGQHAAAVHYLVVPAQQALHGSVGGGQGVRGVDVPAHGARPGLLHGPLHVGEAGGVVAGRQVAVPHPKLQRPPGGYLGIRLQGRFVQAVVAERALERGPVNPQLAFAIRESEPDAGAVGLDSHPGQRVRGPHEDAGHGRAHRGEVPRRRGEGCRVERPEARVAGRGAAGAVIAIEEAGHHDAGGQRVGDLPRDDDARLNGPGAPPGGPQADLMTGTGPRLLGL